MNGSFDLEKALEYWRGRLASRRTFDVDDLDEIEAHIRDHVEAAAEEGSSVEAAFHDAIKRLGDEEEVEVEYRKTRWSKARRRGRAWREWASEWAIVASYVKIGFRNLLRHKSYAVINVAGLSLGIACCVIILLFVLFETSFDRHHGKADRIYRVTRSWFDENDRPVMHLARISLPIAPALEREFPEVELAVRLWQVSGPISYEGKLFDERRLFFVDSTYFEIFDHRLVRGTASSVLAEPFSIFLSEQIASKYFGDADPVGKRLTLFDQAEVVITGVFEPAPVNAHVHPEILVSLSTANLWIDQQQRSHWGMFNNFGTYILLAERASADVLEAKLDEFLRRHYEPENESRDELRLQALTDIHLHSNLDAEFEPNGNIDYVYLFIAIALFVLLIACFNFVNLSTARSAYRSREVGMRKVLGARPVQIVRQFLGEALALALVSTVVAVGIAAAVLPHLSAFTDRDLGLAAQNMVQTVILLILLSAAVGLFAGSYPAFFLSRYQPSEVLRKSAGGSWRSRLRSSLVIVQFIVAIVLICGMGLVLRQVEFVRSKQLGFDKEHLVVIQATDEIRHNFVTVRDRLLESPHVKSVTASRLIPSGSLVDHIGVRAEVKGTMRTASIPLNPIDHDFIDTYGMQLVAGRTLSKDLSSDSTEAFVLNEAAVRLLGWDAPDDAVGSRFILDGNSLKRSGTVVGVVKDFHFESLREEISPLVMFVMPSRYRNLTVRLAADDVEAGLAVLENLTAEFRPNTPFRYSFVDQNFGSLYDAEQRLGRMFGYFAGLAVVIACLGLFGLASFTTERRSKEIGIRKAMGASVAGIVGTLSRDYLLHVAIAFLLAFPVAFVLMRWWLQGFAYRIGFGFDLFLTAGLAVAVVAFLAVGFQSFKSAMASPVTSLRDE